MAEVKKTIRVGDLVKVCYPESDITNNPARRLDGQEFIVKSKRPSQTKAEIRISISYLEQSRNEAWHISF